MSLSIETSERTSLASSSNLRKAAKASKANKATERILYKEAIESTLQATNCFALFLNPLWCEVKMEVFFTKRKLCSRRRFKLLISQCFMF